MSDNNNSRRDFLRKTFVVIPAVSIAGCGFDTSPQPPAQARSSADSPASKPRSDYQPRYFSDTEWAFICAACAHLIPSDELGPGAIEAGVPEFIDRQMDTPYGYGGLWYMQGPFDSEQLPELGYQLKLTPREIYRLGITECNAWCSQSQGKPFAQLDHQAQIAVLEQLDGDKLKLRSLKGSLLMEYLVKNTQEGYFADPIYGGNQGMVGWKMIGFPGARADFMDWIDHPNKAYPLGPVSISGERS